MSSEFDPAYVAGLFDTVGRVHFSHSDADDGNYTVRPKLRLKPYQVDLRTAVIDEFLEERGYQYDLVDRGGGDEFFQLQQRSDLVDLQSYLAGESATLVRELTFVNTVFREEFDYETLAPRDLYRFALARDKPRYGWQPRGRYHLSPDDLVDRHDFSPEAVTAPSLPPGDLRTDYSVEWMAGVWDGRCRYRPSVTDSDEYEIGYGLYPIARLHRAGVSERFVSNVVRFCEDYDLSFGDSSDRTSLGITFTGPANIRRVLDVLFPRLLVLA